MIGSSEAIRPGAARRAAATAVLTLFVLFGALPATAATVGYVCQNGARFTAEFSAGGDRLLLEFPGGHRVELTEAVSGSGFRYTGGGYELHGKGPEALLTRPGEAPVNCREERTSAGPTPPAPPPPPAAASPSFRCFGNLTPAEGRICTSPRLAELDRRLAQTYAGLVARLGGEERDRLQQDQRDWLGERNRCGADDRCIEETYEDRIADLNEYRAPGAPPPPGSPPPPPAGDRASFPFPAQSWGGVVRDGPGQQYRRLAGLREGEPITLLENTGVMLNGFPWFRIGYRGGIGYHWGGIICPRGQPVPGTYQVCN